MYYIVWKETPNCPGFKCAARVTVEEAKAQAAEELRYITDDWRTYIFHDHTMVDQAFEALQEPDKIAEIKYLDKYDPKEVRKMRFILTDKIDEYEDAMDMSCIDHRQ